MIKYISLGYLLNTAALLAKRDISTRMQALGLTFPQWVVLRDILLHENSDSSELTMAAIARRLKSNRPNILGIVDRLVNLGLVSHGVNPDNRRAHIVTVTDKARDAASQLQDLSRETTDKALQGFSAGEESAVREFLARIIANLNTGESDID